MRKKYKIKNYKKIKKISINNILKGKFLIKNNAEHYWKLIIFLIILALITITNSHIVDRKIEKINLLQEKIYELQSEYIIVHKYFMNMRLESKIKKIAASKGLKSLKELPYELKIK